MSGIKPIALSDFYRKIHARGMDTKVLAEFCRRNPSSIFRVLNGSRRRGPLWKRIQQYLTPAEIALLDVAECSMKNIRLRKKRPQWTPELHASLAGVPIGEI